MPAGAFGHSLQAPPYSSRLDPCPSRIRNQPLPGPARSSSRTAAKRPARRCQVRATDVARRSAEARRSPARSRAHTHVRGRSQKLLPAADWLRRDPPPCAGDTVSVHYAGRLVDGTEFDNSIKRGSPITFVLGQGRVIKGWDQGINGMCVGEKRKLKVRSCGRGWGGGGLRNHTAGRTRLHRGGPPWAHPPPPPPTHKHRRACRSPRRWATATRARPPTSPAAPPSSSRPSWLRSSRGREIWIQILSKQGARHRAGQTGGA